MQDLSIVRKGKIFLTKIVMMRFMEVIFYFV